MVQSMLRLHKVESSRLDYYLAVTSTESNSPFFERDGYWLGRDGGSGSQKPVLREQLVDVVHGTDPTTGRSLNPYQSRVRYCAIDATFAAPKTVSVLHVLGDSKVRSAIENSHRQSVLEVMEFVGRKLIVVQRPRRIEPERTDPQGTNPQGTNPQGTNPQGTGRISIRGSTLRQAVFEHRTSRSSDPHLHSHVLLPNVATSDGACWSAFDSRPIYIHSALLGSLYRASLRRHLSVSAGVQWREIQPGWYDVVGLSPPMVRAFSRRSTEILAEMTRHGFASSKAAAITSARLRGQRDLTLSYDELRASWQQLAFRVGISPSRVQEMTGVRSLSEGEHDSRRYEAVRAVTKQGGTQTFSSTLRSVADQLREGVTVKEAEAEIDLAVQRGVLVAPTDLWPFGPRGVPRSGPKRRRDVLDGWSGQDFELSGRPRGARTVQHYDDDFALSL